MLTSAGSHTALATRAAKSVSPRRGVRPQPSDSQCQTVALRVLAALTDSSKYGRVPGNAALHRWAIRDARGAISFNAESRTPATPEDTVDAIPVMLPPGRA